MDYDNVNSDLLLEKMSERLTVSEVLQRLEDNDFSLSEEDDSDFEGENIEGYLPRVDVEVCSVEQNEGMEEEEEGMEEEEETMDCDYIASDENSICSEDCGIQPLGKLYTKNIV